MVLCKEFKKLQMELIYWKNKIAFVYRWILLLNLLLYDWKREVNHSLIKTLQWFPLKPVASYMTFYFLILTGYFFVSYIFYIENFNMIKIKLNLLMHSVPIMPVGMIKYLQRMANLASSRVCLLHSMADHACSRDKSTL